ncbi:MAG TPA: hypothetical protein VFB62_00315, partial [Polyangiaceae bacterium]|nr:hypothetical protein [Polyangiaceae bacterium]
HRASVRTVAFCGSDLLASGGNDGSVRLWKIPSGRVLATLGGHTGGVRGLAASADGHYLSTVARDFVVRMWDVRVSAEHATSSGHSAWVYAASFSIDGKTIASASMDRTIGLWDVETGEQRHVLEGHTGGVHDVAFSPNGELLASAGLDQTARIWDLKSGAELRVLRGHRSTLRTLGFSPDGRMLATAGGDGTVRLWDVARGGELDVLRGHIGDVFESSFDPRGERLASAGNDGKVQLWRTGTWTKETVLEHGTPVRGASFSPDGKRLVTGTDEGDVLLWDLTTRTSTKLGHHSGRVYHVSFDPSGERVGAPSSDGIGIIRSIADPTRTVVLRGHRSEVNTLRFSPDGKLALTSSDDGTLRLWESDSGRPRWRAPVLLAREGASPVLLTHRGWLTPSAGGAHSVELAKSAWRHALEEHALFVDAHHRMLCVQTHSGSVELWDRDRDARVAELERSGIRQLAATPHGCVVLSDEGAAWLHPEHGPARLVTDQPPTAIGLGRSAVYVAAGRELLAFSLSSSGGDRTAEHHYRSSIGVSALVETEDAIVVGYRDGNVESIPLDPQAEHAGPHFEQVPESPVVRVIPGPMGTLVVGYANGLIGLWSQRDGTRLAHARLHGQVVHMLIADQRLYAATDLGRHLVWDLSAFYRERCELLREVWERVPVVWEYGEPVRREPPADHPCR